MSALTDITDGLIGAGYSTADATALAASIDSAGYNLVPKAGGDPVAATDSTGFVVRSLAGRPGAMVYAAKVGVAGWHIWVEQRTKDGVERMPSVFVPQTAEMDADDPFEAAAA